MNNRIFTRPFVLLMGLLLMACVPVQAESGLAARVQMAAAQEVNAFEEAWIIIDSNRTVVDTEVQMWMVADAYMRVLEVVNPNGIEVLRIESYEPHGLGTHESLITIPDMYYDKTKPDVEAHAAWVEELFGSYPEGTYQFYGEGYDGSLWFSEAELTHEQPDTTEILFPTEGAVIAATGEPITVEWIAVEGVEKWQLQWEKGGTDIPEQKLDIDLSGDVTTFDIPGSLVTPGTEFKLSIIGYNEQGNSTSVDTNFTSE